MQQGERIRAEPPPLPSGRYRVVTIDPPWPYDVREDDPSHLSATPYPQMSVADISALPIPVLLHEDAALWLWVTNCHLLEGAAHAVLAAWGLTPRTMLTWTKNHMRRGYWLRNKTEHCILATRGRPTITLTNQTTALLRRRRPPFGKARSLLCAGGVALPGARLPRAIRPQGAARLERFGATRCRHPLIPSSAMSPMPMLRLANARAGFCERLWLAPTTASMRC